MRNPLKLLIPGLLVVTLLSLTVDAQTSPYPFLDLATSKPTSTTNAASTPLKSGAAHEAHRKAECAEMAAKMAKKSEMQAKLDGMDANLDRLAAEMNTFRGYQDVGSNEEPMVAVINELIAQQKSFHAMMSEMHPAMMASSMHPMNADGSKGMMDCSMMSDDKKPSR
jgi:hypothetical protein